MITSPLDHWSAQPTSACVTGPGTWFTHVVQNIPCQLPPYDLRVGLNKTLHPIPCAVLITPLLLFFFFWICHRRNIPLSKVLFLFPPGGHQVDASHSQAKAQRSLCGGTRLSRTRPCILSLSPLFTSLFRMCYLLT